MPFMVKTEEETGGAEGVYEIGYLVASALSEEKLGGFVDELKNIITKLGGVIISEEFPRKICTPASKIPRAAWVRY